jgi:hypothetical protein
MQKTLGIKKGEFAEDKGTPKGGMPHEKSMCRLQSATKHRI